MSGPQLFGFITLGSTVGLLIVCFVLYAVLQRKRHLRCPHCGARFKAAASKTFFAARDGVAKRLTCPECGYFGFMDDCRDSEEPPSES